MFDTLLEPYVLRALAASSLVGVMCGVLGCFIVLRNMALIGDALSHAVLPGVVVGFLIAGHSIQAFFTGAVVAGLLAAVLITLIQRNVKTKPDAAVGIVFSSMFALGVMGISALTRRQGVHLDMKDFLFGNILGISDADLLMTALITLYVLVCVALLYRFFWLTTFGTVIAQAMGISVGTLHYFLMLLLSFAVVAALQTVGVILVVAMLIMPASTALLLSGRMVRVLLLSAAIGLITAVLGLLAALWLDTTPGPAMTVVGALFYLLAVLFSPKRGLLLRRLRTVG